ncbi:MAG: SGNH/GDSL hydrolase family protein [Polyangiaceae bacterium]
MAFSAPIDAYDEAAIATCQKLERGTKKCGVKSKPIDIARFEASALPIDPLTEERIARVAALGKAKGMDPRSFALVGDSITVFRDFMRPFRAKTTDKVVIAPEVERALALDPAASGGKPASIIDWYRGHEVETYAGKSIDAFGAERAAKVGARASWPLIGGEASPLVKLVERVHPAIAIVAFGANDAAYRTAPIEELAREFDANMMKLVEALESRGVIVILENEMRHGDQPGVKSCPSDDAASNDWRTAVATNLLVRRTAEIACREHLPFVDFRYALDEATAHGLGPDAVHPSINGKAGGGRLDELGLDCGFNIRSLVTLLELRNVVNALVRRGVFPPL